MDVNATTTLRLLCYVPAALVAHGTAAPSMPHPPRCSHVPPSLHPPSPTTPHARSSCITHRWPCMPPPHSPRGALPPRAAHGIHVCRNRPAAARHRRQRVRHVLAELAQAGRGLQRALQLHVTTRPAAVAAAAGIGVSVQMPPTSPCLRAQQPCQHLSTARTPCQQACAPTPVPLRLPPCRGRDCTTCVCTHMLHRCSPR